MIEITFNNKSGKKKLKSSEIEELLDLMGDVEFVKDVSDTINESNIMVFDCKLDKSAFKYEYLEDDFYDEVEVGQEYYEVLFEDIKEYIRDFCEDIENDIQEKYENDQIKCEFEIYDLDETFTDVKFVFCICFKEIKRLQFMDFTKRISKKQVNSFSKYIN